MHGTRTQAVADFDAWIHYKKTGNKEGALCDGIIAALLCGDENTAKKWSGELKDTVAQRMKKYGSSLQDKANGTRAYETDPDYLNRQKGKLQKDILSVYFEKTSEEIDAMLETEQDLEICHFCTYHLCKELEGVRVMHLFHTGRVEEALSRIERNLKLQPYDEYMLGAKHMLVDHPKDPVQITGRDVKNLLRAGRILLRGLT